MSLEKTRLERIELQFLGILMSCVDAKSLTLNKFQLGFGLSVVEKYFSIGRQPEYLLINAAFKDANSAKEPLPIYYRPL